MIRIIRISRDILFFFEGIDDATTYNTINERLMKVYEPEIISKISHQNALCFIRELWE